MMGSGVRNAGYGVTAPCGGEKFSDVVDSTTYRRFNSAKITIQQIRGV
jgi:hypothetical protein